MTKFMEKTEIKDLSIKDAVQKLNMGDMNIHTLRDVLNCQNATDQDTSMWGWQLLGLRVLPSP